MYWLEDHLEDGSFKTCYADTDSMALALTKSGPETDDPEASLRSLFDPIVKPSMKESWEATWKSWFVTTNEIWDIRKPGKLKGNFQNIHLNNFVQNIYLNNFVQNIHLNKNYSLFSRI